jgi:hypothetical protein
MPLDLLVGVVVGAAAASPGVRNAVRQGLIRGLGSLLVAYDKVAAVAQEAAKGARKGAAAAGTQATPPAATTGTNGAPAQTGAATPQEPAAAATPSA